MAEVLHGGAKHGGVFRYQMCIPEFQQKFHEKIWNPISN